MKALPFVALLISSAYVSSELSTFRKAWALRYSGRLDEAISLLQSFVSEHPKGPHSDEALLLLGGIMEERGDLEAASEFYKFLLARFPKSPYAEEASFQLAYIKLLREDFVGAFAGFLSFERRFPGSSLIPLAEFHMGKALYSLGHFYGAEERFSRFLDVVPRHRLAPEAWLGLGLCRLALDRTREAADIFWYILRNFPESPARRRAAFSLGELYFNSGRFYLAIGAFRRAAEGGLDSLSDEALLYIERAKYKLGQYRDPIDPAREFVRKYPQRPLAGELQLEIGRYYEEGRDLDRAMGAYRRVLTSPRWKAQHPKALLGIARCLKRRGKTEEAIGVLDTLIEEYSGREVLEALLMKASLYRGLEAIDRAVDVYEGILDRTEGKGRFALEALRGLGICYQTLGRWSEAAGVYCRVLEDFPKVPDRAEVILKLAEAYVQAGEPVRALGALRKEVEEPLDPSERAKLLVRAGKLATELGEWEEAGEYFREALGCGIMEERAEALLGLARLALARGDTAEALPFLKGALEDGSEEAKRLLGRLLGEHRP
ncbi:MAG TPA: tetratricopeptide repeat protein [Candidatus Latescibacteria bacterium]|nr:tetratricopeptide repeat protein [Candidatus Latescibacterota bacterium]